MPVVNLTLAILRSAELGFLGVMVRTCKHTPRLCGQAFKAGDLLFFFLDILPNLINCEIVGIGLFLFIGYVFDNFNITMAAETRSRRDKVPDNNVFFQTE